MGSIALNALTNLSSDGLSGLTDAHIQSIPADTFGYVINEDVIAELSDAALGAMSADQVMR